MNTNIEMICTVNVCKGEGEIIEIAPKSLTLPSDGKPITKEVLEDILAQQLSAMKMTSDSLAKIHPSSTYGGGILVDRFKNLAMQGGYFEIKLKDEDVRIEIKDVLAHKSLST